MFLCSGVNYCYEFMCCCYEWALFCLELLLWLLVMALWYICECEKLISELIAIFLICPSADLMDMCYVLTLWVDDMFQNCGI